MGLSRLGDFAYKLCLGPLIVVEVEYVHIIESHARGIPSEDPNLVSNDSHRHISSGRGGYAPQNGSPPNIFDDFVDVGL